MQRIPLLSLALLSTVAASSAAVAGPLSLKGTSNNDDFFVRSIAGAAGR